MRNVPELRFDGFDGEWDSNYLKKLASIYDGTHQTPNYTKSGVKFLSVENIKDLKATKYISEKDFEKNFKVFPEFNDILMTRIGSVGITNIIKSNERFAYYVTLALIKPKEWIFPEFLNYSINSHKVQKEIWKRTLHVAFPNKINMNQIGEIPLKYPVWEEQEKIGVLFKKLDSLIEIQEGKVSKMEDFKKSMLQKMFPKKGELVPEFRFDGFDSNWLLSRLGEVTSLRGGYAFKSQNYIENGIPILRISNINANGTTNEDYVYYTEISNDDNISLDNGAIVLAMSGATTGKISILKTQGKVYQNQRVGYFTKSDIVDYLYLSVILRSHLFTSQLDKILITGAQPNISSKDVENFSFKFPSLEEQQKIGKFFKNLDAQIENEEKLLESYKNMKKSLLQKMFV